MPFLGIGTSPMLRRGGGIIPALLKDGNTWAYYDCYASGTITKDTSDRVSVWKDRLGSGHDLLQATGASQPLVGLDGLYFDGARRLKTEAATLNQPCAVYIVFTITNELSGTAIFDGNANDSMEFKFASATSLQGYAGAAGTAQNSDKRLNNVARMLYNAASSKFYLNGTDITCSLGTSNAGGFTLGGKGVATTFNGRVIVKAVIIRKIADTADNDAAILAYLTSRFVNRPARGKIAYTFDDISTACYTVLAEYARFGANQKATFYICGWYMATSAAGYCTTAQVQELAAAGHDIQCHGYQHYHFPALSQADLLKNITDNDAYFASASLPAPVHVGYPFGDYSEQVITWLKEQGKRISGRTYYAAGQEAYMDIIHKSDDLWTLNGIAYETSTKEIAWAKMKEAGQTRQAVCMVSHGWSTTHYEQIAMSRIYGLEPVTISQLYSWMTS